MADFLRTSPWSAAAGRAALCKHQVRWLVAEAERTGATKVIDVNINDSLGEKDQHPRALALVDWFYAHTTSTKRKCRYKKAFCYAVCTLRVGDNVVTLDLQLYLWNKAVRKLNRQRAAGGRIPFRSKYRIAQHILVNLAPLISKGWQVYVRCDGWYASARLLKYVHRQGWHTTCGFKGNRTQLKTHAEALKHKWHNRSRVTTADGDT